MRLQALHRPSMRLLRARAFQLIATRPDRKCACEAFPTAWHQFKNEGDPLHLDVKQDHYPFFTKMLGVPDVVGGVVGVVRKADSTSAINLAVTTPIAVPTSAYTPVNIGPNHYGAIDLGDWSNTTVAGVSQWTITAETAAQVDAIEDLYLLLVYKTV